MTVSVGSVTFSSSRDDRDDVMELQQQNISDHGSNSNSNSNGSMI
jgi:hypothetical protein